MNRNDKTYFRRITPELIEARFKGYAVPTNIRKRVALIMKRFTLFGSCDAMYVANTIAYYNKLGDGQGHFENGDITEVKKTAAFLTRAYACNIFPEDERDLMEILETGSLPREKMIRGLKNSIRVRQNRITGIKNDVWRKEFLHGEINLIRDTILAESA